MSRKKEEYATLVDELEATAPTRMTMQKELARLPADARNELLEVRRMWTLGRICHGVSTVYAKCKRRLGLHVSRTTFSNWIEGKG